MGEKMEEDGEDNTVRIRAGEPAYSFTPMMVSAGRDIVALLHEIRDRLPEPKPGAEWVRRDELVARIRSRAERFEARVNDRQWRDESDAVIADALNDLADDIERVLIV